mmetsp:Transcript_44921/g.128299  ORF Transcript_44921/g.128299 Transcript_44921/m.128299 type:complete len:268 (+) Transcript_44921:595-1398(+)
MDMSEARFRRLWNSTLPLECEKPYFSMPSRFARVTSQVSVKSTSCFGTGAPSGCGFLSLGAPCDRGLSSGAVGVLNAPNPLELPGAVFGGEPGFDESGKESTEAPDGLLPLIAKEKAAAEVPGMGTPVPWFRGLNGFRKARSSLGAGAASGFPGSAVPGCAASSASPPAAKLASARCGSLVVASPRAPATVAGAASSSAARVASTAVAPPVVAAPAAPAAAALAASTPMAPAAPAVVASSLGGSVELVDAAAAAFCVRGMNGSSSTR